MFSPLNADIDHFLDLLHQEPRNADLCGDANEAAHSIRADTGPHYHGDMQLMHDAGDEPVTATSDDARRCLACLGTDENYPLWHLRAIAAPSDVVGIPSTASIGYARRQALLTLLGTTDLARDPPAIYIHSIRHATCA